MEIEDHYFHDSKQDKKERKAQSAKDRSKYKKTDVEQKKKHETKKTLSKGELRGRVLAILPESVLVEAEEKEHECILRGVLKKERTKEKNLVAVGDFVHFIPKIGSLGSIVYVEERRSILSRAEHYARKKQQIIATNIDQVLITCSLFIPRLKPALIDRYIIAAKKGNMEPIILLNKIDLLKNLPDLDPKYIEEELSLFEQICQIYPSLHIPVIKLSAETKEGIDELKKIMKDKASVFSGQSGAGKSSLINEIIGTDLKVGDVIEKTRKGSHTTTSATLLPLSEGGFCIDTPGIRSFGIWELTPEEIKKYFREIDELSTQCRFPNCSHTHEPDCHIKVALNDGKISQLRYKSYLSLMGG